MPGQRDEQEIRELVSAWMDATKAGKIEKVLSLMSDMLTPVTS
jgi:ketosteroid isomerase-like protein